MGLPDSAPVFLSQKDIQFPMENECNLFFRPSLEFQDACQIAPSEDERFSEHEQDEQREAQQGQEQDRSDRVLLEVSSSLEVKLPSVREDMEDEEEDGCKTPTSMDHKIPLVCPPPPRKLKPLPSTNKKGSRRRVFLDLSDEIESLFPPALLADFGNKIKKVRKESLII